MDTEGAVQEAPAAEALEDGRTRCAWVRGRPEHYLFHDAEWGRLPDVEAPVFERILLTCLERDEPLVDVLLHRMEIYEAFCQWDYEAAAQLSDADLDALAACGGLLGDRDRLAWLRVVAAACVALKKEFKGVRDYFLAMPSLTPEEQLEDVAARFPGFEKEDAARLIQMLGCVGGSIPQLSHDRDCWIY